MSCGAGCRYGLDLVWLWRRLAATTPVQPLAWEPLYTMAVALKRRKKKKKTGFVSTYTIHCDQDGTYHKSVYITSGVQSFKGFSSDKFQI